ncbi:MAG: hypothetical protein J6U54_13355 [Clostridiales bacterium]|nr:hypothetical protein [Clostridiales bacterium]
MNKSTIYSIIAGVLGVIGLGFEIKSHSEQVKELEQASLIHFEEKDKKYESEEDPE